MLQITEQMKERMAAGLSFLYTTRSGHVWYIDSTLRFPFRQVDFAESLYDAYDGTNFEPSYPDLATCQFALEEGCPEWRGVGWYWIGNDAEDVPPDERFPAIWIDSIDDLKERVAVVKENFEKHGLAWMANYGGNGSEAVTIY